MDVVHELLTECVNGYDEKTKDFDTYRKWISNQENAMDLCVESLIRSIFKGSHQLR